jgi:hypothetical protein
MKLRVAISSWLLLMSFSDTVISKIDLTALVRAQGQSLIRCVECDARDWSCKLPGNKNSKRTTK